MSTNSQTSGDGLTKDYKKLNDYIEGTCSANWWGMNRDLCKKRKLPLEFSEQIYTKIKNLVGKRQIYGRAVDVVDSDHIAFTASKALWSLTPLSTSSYLCWSRQPCHELQERTQPSRGWNT